MKLVRDRVEAPKECLASVNNEDLLDVLLRLKLVEEAVEYSRSGDVEELADVIEVVRAIAERHGLTLEDVLRLAEQKRAAKGGFTRGRVLYSRCRHTP